MEDDDLDSTSAILSRIKFGTEEDSFDLLNPQADETIQEVPLNPSVTSLTRSTSTHGIHVSLASAQHVGEEKIEAKCRETQSQRRKRKMTTEEKAKSSRKKKQNTNMVGSSSSHRDSQLALSAVSNSGPSINRGRGGQGGRDRGRRPESGYMNQQQYFGLQQRHHFWAPDIYQHYLLRMVQILARLRLPTIQRGGPSGSTVNNTPVNQQQYFGSPHAPPRPELNQNAFPSQEFLYPNQQQMHPQTQSQGFSAGQSFHHGGARPGGSPGPTVDQNCIYQQQHFHLDNTASQPEAFPSQEFPYPNQQQIHPQTQQTQFQGFNAGQTLHHGGIGRGQHLQPQFQQGGRGRGQHLQPQFHQRRRHGF